MLQAGCGGVTRCRPSGRRVRQVKTAHLLDFDYLFCTKGRCPAIIGGVDVYRDDHHVTATYEKTLAPYLRDHLRRYQVLGTPQ